MKGVAWVFAGLLGLLFAACGSETENHPNLPSADSISIPIDTVEVIPEPLPEPKRISEYEQTFMDSGLVEIAEFVPGVQVELKYSTTDNFINSDVYGDLDLCYLRGEAAVKLKQAQELLQEEMPGYSLLLYDCTRPHRVQQVMWDQLDIPYKRNYLAPPSEGSVHNYGCAVDLTVVNELGEPLDMGTPFDFFGPLAQPQKEASMLASGKLTEEQHANRLLLRRTMRKAGFYDIRTEWWHFNAFSNKVTKRRFSRIP